MLDPPRKRTPGSDATPTRAVELAPPRSTAESLASADHCPRCICRCRCHRPPEQPVWVVPPTPGDPFWSAHLAALSVELGDLAAAYAAIDGRVAA
jgi:hypothetical protein